MCPLNFSATPPNAEAWSALGDYEPGGYRNPVTWREIVRFYGYRRGVGELTAPDDWSNIPEGQWCRALALSLNGVIVIRWLSNDGLDVLGGATHEYLLCRDDEFDCLRSGYIQRAGDGTFLISG
jgi:hypothetical protein